MENTAPIVLVHGFWHGSWCWSAVTEELASRGLASVAVDLEGHGLNSRAPAARWARPFDPAGYATEPSPSAALTLSAATEELAERVRRIGRGEPCLVVAHSMGGTVATALAERFPELVAGVVYVSAFAPTAGLPAAAYITSPENKGSMVGEQLAADPMAVGALRFDTGDSPRHAAFVETFYADVPAEVAAAAIALLTSDAPAGIATESLTVTAARYGRLPRTYVVCEQDNAIRPDLQRRLIREIDAIAAEPTTVVTLDASHSPFLSQPAALVDAIEKAHYAAGPPNG
jgi:pimeloyl-ACP methyl ester carboxylesterase